MQSEAASVIEDNHKSWRHEVGKLTTVIVPDLPLGALAKVVQSTGGGRGRRQYRSWIGTGTVSAVEGTFHRVATKAGIATAVG